MTSPAGVAALAALAADGLAGAGWSSSLSVLVLMCKYGCGMLVYVCILYMHAHVYSMCIVHVYVEMGVRAIYSRTVYAYMCVHEREYV